MKCNYAIPWLDTCTKNRPCAQHKDLKCWKCDNPAVANCSVASSLVCGMPYCADHPHEPTHYQSRDTGGY